MLKKSLIIFITIICMSLSAVADTNLQNNTDTFLKDSSHSSDTDICNNQNREKDKKEIKDKIKNKHSKKKKLKKAKEFKSITECNSRAIKNNVAAYVRFTSENDFSDEQLEIINRILEKGTTIQTLTEVYDFWLTTDEEFLIVEKICEMEKSYFSVYWYENAFNKLTNHVHGELTGTEIIEYQEMGISTEHILAANIMSRKRGQNIKVILDAVISGDTIENQAKAIYGTELVVGDDSLSNAVYNLAESIGRTSRNLIIDEFSHDKQIYHEAVNDIISEEIKGLALPEQSKTYAEDYNSLRKSCYPINVQMTLLNKGFTPQEIEKSSHIDSHNLLDAAKIAREMLKDEE